MRKIESKTDLMVGIENVYNFPLEHLLRELYVDHKYTIQEIADEFGIRRATCSEWLKLAGITSQGFDMETE